MTQPLQFMVDAYSLSEIIKRVRESGVLKARADVLTVFVLAVLAGAFIGESVDCFETNSIG